MKEIINVNYFMVYWHGWNVPIKKEAVNNLAILPYFWNHSSLIMLPLLTMLTLGS